MLKMSAQACQILCCVRFISIQLMNVVHAKLRGCQGSKVWQTFLFFNTTPTGLKQLKNPRNNSASAVRCGSSGLGLYVLSGQLPMGVLSGQLPTPKAHTFHWGPMCPPALIAFATMRALARRRSVLVVVCCSGGGAPAAAARGGWWWC